MIAFSVIRTVTPDYSQIICEPSVIVDVESRRNKGFSRQRDSWKRIIEWVKTGS